MKRRDPSLIIAALLSSTVASAQIRTMSYVPSAPTPGLSASAVMSVRSAGPIAAIPVLPVAAAAPVVAAAPAASAPVALESARALTVSFARADAATSLSAAFDGRLPAPSVAVDAEPRTPEAFALKAEGLFTAGRLPVGQRAAVAWKDGARTLGVLPTDKEMQERMARSPLTNAEREKVVIELFKLGGAKAEEIVVSDIGRGQNNIMVVKKGRTDRVIVVGGHHDKVSRGAGTIDNWTGTTMVTNLYQSLRDQDTDATIVFISFGREEDGLVGSARYLETLSKTQRVKIDAMVNLDTLAVDGTFSWKNNSTRALLDRVKTVASDTKHDLKEAYLDGGDADSSTFRQAGIPAMTLFGASQDVIFDVIHSENDSMAAFSLDHYRNAFLLSLELLKSIDREKFGPRDV